MRDIDMVCPVCNEEICIEPECGECPECNADIGAEVYEEYFENMLCRADSLHDQMKEGF